MMEEPLTKPNVVLIVLDTLRADRMSCYGYGRRTTPFIDAFAEDATVFERAVVPGQWTIPSHASLFTGEYPTTHMTNQIYDSVGDDLTTLAELLRADGYRTVGFCNNPLLGVVDNELEHGFEEFYNYGGAVPNYPDLARAQPRAFARLAERLTHVIRRLTAPFQNQFAHNNALLRIAMHPWIVPLWQGSVNFKGNTKRSLHDVVRYLRVHRASNDESPIFAFINLMETHLPYQPPARFTRKLAPYYEDDTEAKTFMEGYNREHYRWMIPLTEPLGEVEDRVLNDLYDAEVAYQDRLLRRLLKDLNKPGARDDTMVIITSDHGEGLNNHDFVGHSLVAYDDLVRTPLVIRYPRQYPAGKRVSSVVSTRRVFHAVLDAAGVQPTESRGNGGGPDEIQALTLTQELNGSASKEATVFAEAYTPATLLALMENETPSAIETFRCRSMRRAAYAGRHKLITVGDEPDELFDVIADPGETDNLLSAHPDKVEELDQALTHFIADAENRRPANWESARKVSLDDEEISERLRALGYIE